MLGSFRIVVATLMVLALSACGGDGNGSGEPDDEDVGTSDIRRPVPDTTRDISRDTARDTAPMPDVDEMDTSDGSDAGDCAEACELVGQIVCADDTSIATCDDSDGDGCFDLVAQVSCMEGNMCTEGSCQEGPCSDECAVDGVAACTPNRRAFRLCADHDDDGCLEFGDEVACVLGEICTAGECPTECEDECDSEGPFCTGDGFATCSDTDGDGCLEIGDEVTDCEAGEFCVDGACSDDVDCLLFSEYVEGSSNHKAIEIVNCGGSPRFLDAVGVCLFANDNDDPPCSSVTMLDGSLGAGDVRVLCNASIGDERGCDDLSAVANFNGDDRLVLFADNGDDTFGSGDTVLDAWGQYTNPPSGNPWEEASWQRCNRTAFSGTEPFDPDDAYRSATYDDLSNLGVAPDLSGCD